MKVILLQDVAKIGRRSQVVDVPDGYALNKLIPKKQAEPATPANLKRIEAIVNKHAAVAADTVSAFKAVCAALKDKKIPVAADANAEGKLFQGLKPQIIAEAIKQETGQAVSESWIHTATPIKTLGEHTVLLSHGSDQGECVIAVTNK